MEKSETHARRALDLLGDRVDHLQEVGTAQLTLGRSLAAEGRIEDAERWIAAADETFERARSTGHRSSAWIALGDVESRRGDDRAAAGLYRRAARALQDAEAELRADDDGLPPRCRGGDRSRASNAVLLAAVEPAAAEGGEEAGKRRHCDDEVPRISLGEHSLSFRWVLPVHRRVRPEGVIGHPRTGDPRAG